VVSCSFRAKYFKYSISNQEILSKYPNEHQSKSDKCISTDSSFVNRLYVIMLF